MKDYDDDDDDDDDGDDDNDGIFRVHLFKFKNLYCI